MIIPVNIAISSASDNGATFPPQLAQFGSEGLILIELQGKLDVAGENDGQIIGTLRVDEATVVTPSVECIWTNLTRTIYRGGLLSSLATIF